MNDENVANMNENTVKTDPTDYPSKVYYDDGELYVSSDEVRIRDRAWKLEDIEYVNLECFEGWVWKVILCIGILVLAYLNWTNCLINSPSFRNVVFMDIWGGTLVVSLFIWPHLWDDLTGFYWLRVFPKTETNQIVSFGGKGKFMHPGAISKYRMKLKAFSNAVNEALCELHESVSENVLPGSDSNPKDVTDKKRDFFVDGKRVRLYGMVLNLDKIQKVFYTEPTIYHGSFWLYFSFGLAFIFLAIAYFFTRPTFLNEDIVYAYSAISYIVIALGNVLFGYPKRLVVTICFMDGTRRIVRKWYDDNAMDTPRKFTNAVRKQMKLNRKAKRAEQHG